VDAGVPGLQGEAERVKTAELVALLQHFYRDKRALRDRHVAGAERVATYEFNNTYQYIVAREDAQLEWLREAIEGLGAPVPEDRAALPLPADGRGQAAERAVIEDDLRLARVFLDRWRGPVQAVTHARHRKMLEVVLAETVEHQRFFEQMLAGREDVLGRRPAGAGTGGGVLPVRWVE
jgi:hypothetical protein